MIWSCSHSPFRPTCGCSFPLGAFTLSPACAYSGWIAPICGFSAKKAALPLLLISAVFACLYCALSHRLSILHAIRPALLAATLLAFFCGIGVWEWLRACPGAGRVVSFFSRHAMGIYYNHVLVIYYLRQFPRFHLGMSGMLLLFAATLCLSTGIAVLLSLVWHGVRHITANVRPHDRNSHQP